MPYKDPAKQRACSAAYYATHPEEHRASSATYRAAHREERVAYSAAYNATHREERAAYRATHREERAAYNAAYRATHRAQTREKDGRRRNWQAQATLNDFTTAQWRTMQEQYDHRCVYCHKRAKGHLTQDHITPLAEGGSHTLANIVPACRSCNSKKHIGAPLVPVQPMLL